MNKVVKGFVLLVLTGKLQAQEAPSTDSIIHKYLKEITVVGKQSSSDIHFLPEIVGTSVYAGKKNALIVLDNVQGNVVNNTMRQVMAKIPGVHVWESDGSGIQIGIAARGLSPNRSWEFNIRQNGYDIAADPFGYPEAYYNPQLQAVQRIEVLRGQAALQYGPQFGGMVNYILRNGSEINKPFQIETQQTVGSNGLLNSYNAIGGEKEKYHYYGFFDHRMAKGWRDNSTYYTNAGFGTFTYTFNKRFSVTAELMQSHIRSQQPGGLTDLQIQSDAQQSLRSRNWFDITWTTAAITTQYEVNNHSRLNAKVFGIFGNRSSIGYLQPINIKDSIHPITFQYNNRIVDVDKYKNVGAELRYLSDYKLGNFKNTFSGGLRFFMGNTFRYKNGKGDTGSGFNTNVLGNYAQDLDFVTFNAAAFVENVIHVGEKWLIIPGIRFEYINAAVSGRLNYNANGTELLVKNENRKRSFLLAGIGAEYHITTKTEFYGNVSQAYRPMLFSDLTYAPTTDVVDENLSDAKGLNMDLGYRGKLRDYLFFDLSVFYLPYNNRIGTIVQQREDGSFYNWRTNVGNSRSKGFEGLVEFSPIRILVGVKKYDATVFASYSFTDARYEDINVVSKVGNTLVTTNLKNKKVENAPASILRTGTTLRLKGFSVTGQWSFTGQSFSDANNTVPSSANAQTGLIPSYAITDLTIAYVFSKSFHLKAGINNLTNERYFTRRAGGYPGPGAMPSDGRNFFVSVGAKF